MDSLPVIPTPASQRWREFRIRYVPILVFSCVVLAIAFVWRTEVIPPLLTGQVEFVRAEVVSPDDGIITNVFVTQFQKVRAGDVIAAILSNDPKRVATDLDMLRSQISLSQLEIGVLLDRQKSAFAYESLRMRFLREQVELVANQALLDPAEKDYNLATKLFEQKILSEPEFNYYSKIYKPIKARTAQTATLIDEMGKEMEKMKSLTDVGADSSSQQEIFDKAISQMQKERKTLQDLQGAPVVLRSPIDGVVQSIHRRQGENILAGVSIVTIASTKSDRIIGYMRQPFPFAPKEGMTVRVRSQARNRKEADSTIASIGGQFEVITNSVLTRPGLPAEVGLPIAVNIPAALKTELHPGEIVELSIRH